MSLKTRLRIAIVALVAVVVVAMSALHVHGVVDARFEGALETAKIHAQQIESSIIERVDEMTALRSPPPQTVEELKRVWTEIIERDSGLSLQLQNIMGSSQVIAETVVTDSQNRILASSLPDRLGQKVPELLNFETFEAKNPWAKLHEVLTESRDYEVRRDLGLPEAEEPIFIVRVILSSVFLREQVNDPVRSLAAASGMAFLLAILLAVVASQIAIKPLERIGEAIDRITKGEADADAGGDRSGREPAEVAAVESKLSLLGEQFRGAQADASKLRQNIDQLLERLEQAVLMFGPDDRLAMAGSGAERLLGFGRWEMMGAPLADVFPESTNLGAFVQSMVHLDRGVKDQPMPLKLPDGKIVRLLVTIETLRNFPTNERLGTVVTLRDAEPRRQIESQLDVSSRLAAISRLTGGAAHEIKNPLNSIALHLEVLKAKLDGSVPEAESTIEVLSREITRLDRVVKSFLDFTRPVDLRMEEVDLVKLASELASLVRPEAQRNQIEIEVDCESASAPIRGDRDLLVQAALNVLVNGVEAMKEGGRLRISVSPGQESWTLSVADQGGGIPAEVQEKIYNLYFSTKGKGSGIGLAMTFRVIQLHGGTIDFATEQGKGTTFHLRFPRFVELETGAGGERALDSGSASAGEEGAGEGEPKAVSTRAS